MKIMCEILFYLNCFKILILLLALNRILSVFTGHMNCIGKKSKLNAPRKRCMKICFSFRCNSYGQWTPTKCDSILIFTSFYNKVCRGNAYFNTKMSYLSDFKRTKSKTHRTASTGRITNWKKPPCDPVQIIRTTYWYFKSLIIVNTATSYFFTNLHVIYFWNVHRERRSNHWHLQLHTRSAERYRWPLVVAPTGWRYGVDGMATREFVILNIITVFAISLRYCRDSQPSCCNMAVTLLVVW